MSIDFIMSAPYRAAAGGHGGAWPYAAADSDLRQVFTHIEPTPSLLHTVFPYTNAIHHSPALLLNVGRVESTGGDYQHYYDGITPSVGRLIDALDAERVAVAAGLGVRIERLPQFFFR